ncbi:MAG: hypothetical protein RMJ53_10155, partial [Chitinophagales bacterium]|nr:hypothetical protein [Chitinophagales bacterium]
MKQKFPLLLLFLFIYSKIIFSQLTPGGIYSIGPNPPYTQPGGFPYTGNFTSLSAAVSQLNLSSASGHYILEFQNDYTPASESFPVVITYVGAPTAVATIRPRSDVPISGISVTGSVSGGPIVFLNGASYVHIDGRPGASGPFSTRRLTFQNNAASLVSNISIGFVAASYNRVAACTLKVNGGNVINLGANGCSHNRIHSNYMSMATTTHPSIGVNSDGSLPLLNTDDTISANIIAYPTSMGINIGTNSTSFVVAENHVGGGLSLNMPANRNFYGIRVASGGGHKIFGNIIGDDFSSSNAIYENINTSG